MMLHPCAVPLPVTLAEVVGVACPAVCHRVLVEVEVLPRLDPEIVFEVAPRQRVVHEAGIGLRMIRAHAPRIEIPLAWLRKATQSRTWSRRE